MRGTLAPGVFVPLQSHDDFETYLMVSGTLEGLVQSNNYLEWVSIEPGEIFHVPGHVRHALRNASDRSAVVIILSTAEMGNAIRAIGKQIPWKQMIPVQPSAEGSANSRGRR
jgi:quercetin dioxygenase-like cupin family protein